MLTELDVKNYALGLLGAEPIKDGDSNKRQRLADLFYPTVVNTALREYDWNFARTTCELSAATNTPEIELKDKGNQFSLPANCVKVLTLHNYDGEYEVAGPFLYAYTDTLVIDYTANDYPVSYWTEDFKKLVAIGLALELSYGLVQSNTLTQSLYQRYDKHIRDFRFNNSTEHSNTTWAGTGFTGARRG